MKARQGDRIPAHMHLKTHEFFYVVDGEISVWMDDQDGYHTKTTLTTGDFAYRSGGDRPRLQDREHHDRVRRRARAGFERFFHAIGQKTERPSRRASTSPTSRVHARGGREVRDDLHARVPVPRLKRQCPRSSRSTSPSRPGSARCRSICGLPAAADAPLVVFLHGGGWLRGSRKVFTPGISDAESFDRIVAAGFAVASCEYRLSGEALFPAQLDDVAAALAWLHAHGAEHGIDASRLVLWGVSAGATLAALTGLGREDVCGVVDWFGPADLIALAEHDTGEPPAETREARWLGAPATDIPDAALRGEPDHPGARRVAAVPHLARHRRRARAVRAERVVRRAPCAPPAPTSSSTPSTAAGTSGRASTTPRPCSIAPSTSLAASPRADTEVRGVRSGGPQQAGDLVGRHAQARQQRAAQRLHIVRDQATAMLIAAAGVAESRPKTGTDTDRRPAATSWSCSA